MAPLVDLLRALLPRYRLARRTFRAAPSFDPLRWPFAERPAPLDDLAERERTAANAASQRYFAREDMDPFWMERPFSDPAKAGWTLSRFGHLCSALGMRQGSRVLDFGCGTGFTSIALARMGAEVVGMDIAPRALSLARDLASRTLPEASLSRLRFEGYEGERIPFPDRSFDTVVVFDALHHLPNPRAILAELHRVLCPNGWLGFAEPGVDHAGSAASHHEKELGVLERDLDLERLYRTGREAGFDGLELLPPIVDPSVTTLSMRRTRWYLRGLPLTAPSYLFRSAMLRAPCGIFWKGPHYLSTLHPRSHEARIFPETHRVDCAPFAPFDIVARVENPTDTVWLREGERGAGYVRLGAQLLDPERRPIVTDYGRAELPRDVRRRQHETLRLHVVAPAEPGAYLVRLDMVNEGRCWFSQESSPVADVLLRVEAHRGLAR